MAEEGGVCVCVCVWVSFVCEREEDTHVEWEVCVWKVEGGREGVVGVRFTLVRLKTFLAFRPPGCLRLIRLF